MLTIHSVPPDCVRGPFSCRRVTHHRAARGARFDDIRGGESRIGLGGGASCGVKRCSGGDKVGLERVID